jgi:hypothetical protein
MITGTKGAFSAQAEYLLETGGTRPFWERDLMSRAPPVPCTLIPFNGSGNTWQDLQVEVEEGSCVVEEAGGYRHIARLDEASQFTTSGYIINGGVANYFVNYIAYDEHYRTT